MERFQREKTCCGGGWKYLWLLSCPAVLFLGYFKWRGLRGVVLLPTLNYRYNVLGGADGVRVTHNVPDALNPSLIGRICSMLSKGIIPRDDPLLAATTYTMYYGGLNIYIIHNKDPYLVSIDMVDTTTYSFYLKPETMSRESLEIGLDDWVIMASSLRENNEEFFAKSCIGVKGTYIDGICKIQIPAGKLLIVNLKKSREDAITDESAYIRIIPDNNPIRHVVNHDKVKDAGDLLDDESHSHK